MYVRKEALLVPRLKVLRLLLRTFFEFERGETPENINDVAAVINYIKALHYGMQRLDQLPMCLSLIKEIHHILSEGAQGGSKAPGAFKKSQNWIGPPAVPSMMQRLFLLHLMRPTGPWVILKNICIKPRSSDTC